MANPDIEDNTTHNTGESSGGDITADSHQKEGRMQIKDIITGVFVPVIIGLWGIFVVIVAAEANDQSQMANQLALLSLCYLNSVRCLDYLVKTYITDIRT